MLLDKSGPIPLFLRPGAGLSCILTESKNVIKDDIIKKYSFEHIFIPFTKSSRLCILISPGPGILSGDPGEARGGSSNPVELH